jgi:hypothetical protein
MQKSTSGVFFTTPSKSLEGNNTGAEHDENTVHDPAICEPTRTAMERHARSISETRKHRP